ncbi:hypothetical protein AOL_s00097g101 [Orbilia oligospora ATCC 24927]|uniref:Uncharacterized protein n=1 Tax=Arthrobotrys oligospora (strain ATCC 24927 / CBS 115.81 / DSM 1491) TaxID=756982 RepID=G1XIC4_ARTOA|nr:hypothetical protein AOL_s00097g101 [Orbilia oligospora ATCC 24927]EGX47055.1 hypothetical protein AOL_s00097g101 [Orbilia oligospora ATCC 24927]
MDRFRELVSKLNVGDLSRTRDPSPQPPAPERVDELEKIIEQLPATKAFVESLPHHKVSKKAAENDKKAVEATQLLHRVDGLIQSHVTAAHDFRKYVEEISNVKAQITLAREQAYSLHQQLIEIDRELGQAEAAVSNVELDRLQQTEDAVFENYAKARRAEVNRKKEEYAEKLMSFQRDRYAVSRDFERPRTSSRPTILSRGPSRPTTSQSSQTAVGVEIQLDEGAHSNGLDDFLGSEETTIREPDTSSLKSVERPERKEVKTKPKKSARITRPGMIPTKAAPARAKIDIMADEDFFD